ncbi:hypothetical protein [Vibrio injensis]|nr:hypothetical protein [Vibrio injensis]
MADSTLHEDPDLINRKWRWRRIAITALFALLLFPLIRQWQSNNKKE